MFSLKVNKNNSLYLFFVALTFSVAVGAGLYGYGNDFYAAYYKNNVSWGGWRDLLGWRISTLTIFNAHVGVYVTSFILVWSTGFLLRESMYLKSIRSPLFFVLMLIVFIHTWPIIMATSNAMRQGLSMSAIFLALVGFSHKKTFKTCLFSILSIFLHKAGLFFACLIMGAFLLRKFNLRFPSHLILSAILALSLYFIIPEIISVEEETRIIGGDYRIAFLSISALFTVTCGYKKNFLNEGYNLFLFYSSVILPIFYFHGLNWEYERMGMMLLLPYIMSFSFIFTKKSSMWYFSFVSFFLLYLTIANGMYHSLV